MSTGLVNAAVRPTQLTFKGLEVRGGETSVFRIVFRTSILKTHAAIYSSTTERGWSPGLSPSHLHSSAGSFSALLPVGGRDHVGTLTDLESNLHNATTMIGGRPYTLAGGPWAAADSPESCDPYDQARAAG